MAKETLGIRIETTLKEKVKDLNDFYSNEEILEAGYQSLTKEETLSIDIVDKNLKEDIESLIVGGEINMEKILSVGYKTIIKSEKFRQTKEENEIIKLVRNMDLTKQKILNLLSQEALNDTAKNVKELEKEIEESKLYFHKKDFNLKFFTKQFDSNDSNFTYKLSRISSWVPFTTLVKMASGDYYFVAEVDHKFDRVQFGIVGKGKGVTIPLQEIINNNGRIKEVYHLKDLTDCEAIKKEIKAQEKALKRGR